MSAPAAQPRRSVVILVSADGSRLLRVRPQLRHELAPGAVAAAAMAGPAHEPRAAEPAAEWELPGAKLKAGETALQAAARGLRKATGLDFAALEQVGEGYAEDARVQAFVCRATADTPDAVAGKGVAVLGWVRRGRRAKRDASSRLKGSLRVLTDLLPTANKAAVVAYIGGGAASAVAAPIAAAAASAGVIVGNADDDDDDDDDDYPFPVEDADHCETPARAYADVAPVLRSLARQLGKTPAELKIYDPYFCQGGVKQNLAQAGFPSVYNRREDCYRVWSEGKAPAFDVLVTNPPYSGEHVARLFQFAEGCGKPWLMLIPAYCATLPCYTSGLEGRQAVAYAAPRKRYRYVTPTGARGDIGKKEQLKTAPFVTLWFIGAFAGHRAATLASLRSGSSNGSSGAMIVAESLAELPAQYKAARGKSDPVSVFCKRFSAHCELDPRLRQAGKLCAMWSLTGGCSCAATSPFVHPLHVDTAALRGFISGAAAAASAGSGADDAAALLPEGWPPLALSSRGRPVPGHPGTACSYWATAAAKPRAGGGSGAFGRPGKRKGGVDAGPRWKRGRR